jgi:transposase
LANQRIGFLRFAACADSQGVRHSGKVSGYGEREQRGGLLALADSRDRGEAGRARAVLLTLAGWTSSKTAEAFGVREDTVRLLRSDSTTGGIAVLKTSIAPGQPPVKSEAALRVITPLLEEPVADRRNCWNRSITSCANSSSSIPARPSAQQFHRPSGATRPSGLQAKPVVLVEENGPIHTSKHSLAALAARAHWLAVD